VARKQKNKSNDKFFTRGTIIGIAIIAVGVSAGIYFGLGSMVPVNGTTPVLQAPTHIYIEALHTADQGYFYDQQSTRQGKKSLSGVNSDPSIHVTQGELVSLHFINEDKETLSPEDLNIDAFNVHTKQLKYFEAQTINFLADKTGTFTYYSTIHPEMKGTITVDAS